MFTKIAVLACALAVASAGYLDSGIGAYESYAAAAPIAHTSYAAPALTATSENVYRSAGNLNTISTHLKSIATPFSSSNKQFTSVTNPGVYAHAAYEAAPIGHASIAAPIASHTTYTAAPLSSGHASYASAAPYALTSGHATGLDLHSADLGYAAAPIAHAGLTSLGYTTGHEYGAALGRSANGASLLGVAYSPAAAVSHMTYSSPIGINYSW